MDKRIEMVDCEYNDLTTATNFAGHPRHSIIFQSASHTKESLAFEKQTCAGNPAAYEGARETTDGSSENYLKELVDPVIRPLAMKLLADKPSDVKAYMINYFGGGSDQVTSGEEAPEKVRENAKTPDSRPRPRVRHLFADKEMPNSSEQKLQRSTRVILAYFFVVCGTNWEPCHTSETPEFQHFPVEWKIPANSSKFRPLFNTSMEFSIQTAEYIRPVTSGSRDRKDGRYQHKRTILYRTNCYANLIWHMNVTRHSGRCSSGWWPYGMHRLLLMRLSFLF